MPDPVPLLAGFESGFDKAEPEVEDLDGEAELDCEAVD